MKISAIRTEMVKVPLPKPIKTAIHKIDSVGCVLVYLETDEGVVGQSYVFTINAIRLKVFDEMIRSLSHQVVGKDPHYVSEIWAEIWAEINPTGHEGVTISALSALDTACWDLIGKAAERPLHHLFGACRDQIRTYASGGLWLSYSIDELVEEAAMFVDQGFKSMKIRLGKPLEADDYARVKAIRDSVGPDIELLTDANQSFNSKHAIRLGRMLEEIGVSWLEEPVARHDLKGQSDVRRALDLSVAAGETEWNQYGFLATIKADAADILMPDLQRIGGLSGMRNVASLAETYNLPISTHIFTEHSLCIAGSAISCMSVEHMPWFEPLFIEKMEIENGNLLVPQRPGTGFTFDEKAVKHYAIK